MSKDFVSMTIPLEKGSSIVVKRMENDKLAVITSAFGLNEPEIDYVDQLFVSVSLPSKDK